MRQLHVEDLTDHHLYWLLEAAYYSVGATAGQWLDEIHSGVLQVWEVPEGLIGVSNKKNSLFVEFLAGKGFAKDPIGLRERLLELSQGRPIEAATKRMGLVRLMARAGFELTAVFMRYHDERR